MHEGNFTELIVDAILQELRHHPGLSAKSVTVKVGEVFHLVPESVQTHFLSLTKGTNLENVRLILEASPVIVHCKACGERGGVEDHHMLVCGRCGSLDVSAISGNEIFVESIDLETNEPAARPTFGRKS